MVEVSRGRSWQVTRASSCIYGKSSHGVSLLTCAICARDRRAFYQIPCRATGAMRFRRLCGLDCATGRRANRQECPRASSRSVYRQTSLCERDVQHTRMIAVPTQTRGAASLTELRTVPKGAAHIENVPFTLQCEESCPKDLLLAKNSSLEKRSGSFNADLCELT